MTQQTYPNSQEAASSSSSGSVRSSTSTADAFPLPFSIGQKKIMDDDGRLVANLADNNVVAPAANICVNDSSHITFGNRTIFNEGVTIYQYIDGNHLPQLQNDGTGQDEVECNKSATLINLENTNVKTITAECDRFKAWKLRTSLLVLALIVITSGLLLLEPILTRDDIYNEVLPNDTTVQEMFIARSMWGGISPRHVTRGDVASLVIVKHTGGNICFDFKSCSKRVREIQRQQMTGDKLVDIEYNFLIGGDGRIYIGRDWFVQNEGWPRTIDIAFIGNFTENLPTGVMLSAGQNLIAQGSASGALDYSDLHVVCHNQTEETESPGIHLCSAVEESYKHYYSTGRVVYDSVGDVI